MLSAKPLSLTRSLRLLLVLLPLSHSQAAEPVTADTVDRAALTQATLELQRDLLLAQEKLQDRERLGLALYLDITPSAKGKIQSIRISLDDQTVVQRDLTAVEQDLLTGGAMQELGVIALQPGTHVLKTTVTGSGRSVTKTLALDKSPGRDHLKITITTLLQQRSPDILYRHDTWAAIQ
ncbi:hypothetical protein Tel_14010 [Candidatus Tenderia electrophaga]|uniref:AraC family transcriptional regulator n=1 Tax=Candidatus Tenderia electrophaga TaxID=1748243 RepID=A0A0S2TG57_9GAMM|nr:hypothetical protein Tel_14010 [Candidatus Tenderia electrophaga]